MNTFVPNFIPDKKAFKIYYKNSKQLFILMVKKGYNIKVADFFSYFESAFWRNK